MTYEEMINGLRGCVLPEWEELPDFGLYMDQIVTYVGRYLPASKGQPELTPSMINNYVKAGLVEKPAGKKYSRSAIAQLLMVSLLKLTTPLDMIKAMLPKEKAEIPALYTTFRKDQIRIIDELSGRASREQLSCALESAALQCILRMMVFEN
ncbi:MAG: DUF1836 domain-containing protein [Firmicutes bacterium]|nr:DUF1836 domain-containing protein [Bacillota bacterium]